MSGGIAFSLLLSAALNWGISAIERLIYNLILVFYCQFSSRLRSPEK